MTVLDFPKQAAAQVRRFLSMLLRELLSLFILPVPFKEGANEKGDTGQKDNGSWREERS